MQEDKALEKECGMQRLEECLEMHHLDCAVL